MNTCLVRTRESDRVQLHPLRRTAAERRIRSTSHGVRMKSAESARQPSVTTNSSAVATIAAIRPAMGTTHSASRPYTSALSFDTSAPLAPNAHSNFEKCACCIPAADVSGRTTFA